jgi:hypothetical protein
VRQQAAKEAAATVAHREQVMATAREQNARLVTELAHTRTMVLQGKHEAERVATLAKLAKKDARRHRQLEGLQKQRHLPTHHKGTTTTSSTDGNGRLGSRYLKYHKG